MSKRIWQGEWMGLLRLLAGSSCGKVTSALALLAFAGRAQTPGIDNVSDTWVATDALGRRVAVFPDVPAPRADRTVGIFYFLWHGAHIQGGPFDVTKILAADPNAM